MSAEYEGQDPLAIAEKAERDLNSHAAKHGHGGSQSGTTSPHPSLSALSTALDQVYVADASMWG